MKIKNIKLKKNSYSVYEVVFVPNWIEKLWGMKEVVKEYKSTGSSYTFGGGNVYVDKKGRTLGNGHWIGEAIDAFKRSW